MDKSIFNTERIKDYHPQITEKLTEIKEQFYKNRERKQVTNKFKGVLTPKTK